MNDDRRDPKVINLTAWPRILAQKLARRRHATTAGDMPVRGIFNDLLWIKHPTVPEHFAAVLQVSTINYSLRTEREQETTHANYQAFLNNMHHPFQWRFSIRQVDPQQLTAPILARGREVQDDHIRHWLADMHHHLTHLVEANHIPRAALYLSLPIPVPATKKGDELHLYMKKESASRCTQAVNVLGTLGVAARRLGSRELLDLCWADLNPDLVMTHKHAGASGLATMAPPPDPGIQIIARSADVLPRDALSAGAQDLGHIIAARDLEYRKHYFENNRDFRCVLTATNWPVYLAHNALRQLTNCNLNLDLSLHVTPFETAAALHFLNERIRRLTMSQTKDAIEGFNPDYKVNRWMEQAQYCRDLLEQGKARWFYAALYVMVTARTRDHLDDAVRQVESLLGQVNIQAHPAFRLQREGLYTCMPLGVDLIQQNRNMLTDGLANLSPLDCQVYMQQGGHYGGISRLNNSLVVLNVWALDNYNVAVLGLPGKGKTVWERHMITNFHCLNDDDQVIGDPDGEMDAQVASLGGATIRMGAGSPHRMNLMDLALDFDNDAQDYRRGRPLDKKIDQLVPWLQHYLGAPVGEKGERLLTPVQTARVKHAIVRAYGRKGITPENQWDIVRGGRLVEMPVLDDLQAELRAVEPELAEGMDIFRFGAMSIFNARTNVEVDNRLVSVNLKNLDPATRDMAMPWILNWMWGRVGLNRSRRRRTHLWFEEILFFLENPVAAQYISMIWTRGRKWWCSPCAVSQLIFRLLENPVGRTVLKTSDLKVLFDQGDAIDDVVAELKLSPQEAGYIRGSVPGDGLYAIGPWRVPFRLALSEYQYSYYTTRPGEMKE